VDLRDALREMWHSVVLFVPKAVAFIAILMVGWIVARVLRGLVNRVLERVGFDRAVERGGVRHALAGGRYDASDLVAALAYYAVLLFTLQLAFGLWGPNPVSDLIRAIVAWLPRAAVAIIILVVAMAIAAAVRDLLGSTLSGLSYGRLMANLANAFIVGIGVVAALNQVGVATTVTTPILITVLATIGGILVVGVGGGLVRPMQQRWERWLSRAEQESPTLREHLRAEATRRREEAVSAAETAAFTTTSSRDVSEAPTQVIALGQPRPDGVSDR
jgi:hypothetical protein